MRTGALKISTLGAVLLPLLVGACAARAPGLASPREATASKAPAATSSEHGAADMSEESDGTGGAPSVAAEPGIAPPPAPSPSTAVAPSAGGASGAARPSTGATSTPPSPPRGDARPIMPTPAPNASIKAGEWDDNANYREFTKWLATEDRVAFHKVDVSDRRFLVVRDAQGKAVPRCKVIVADEKQHSAALTTTASGHAILFPHAEGLQGRELTAIANCEGTTATSKFSIGDASDGMVDLKLQTTRTLAATRTIDVAFILDTTGSMGEEIAAVKSTIQKVASSLNSGNVHVRIGMVAFKDRGDEYVTKVYPMTTDLGAFQRDVANIRAGGGGDTPESVNEGVHVALTKLDWGQDAVAKFAFLVGDAPPHLDYAQDFDYAVDMKDAAHRGIQMFTIAASGMDVVGQIVFRQIAEYTGATNLFVMRGGAGPQSTGAGDPRSSCGGTQTQYASGNLDALILGKIHQELKSIDRDPTKIAGLGKDENAKPCNERLLARD